MHLIDGEKQNGDAKRNILGMKKIGTRPVKQRLDLFSHSGIFIIHTIIRAASGAATTKQTHSIIFIHTDITTIIAIFLIINIK